MVAELGVERGSVELTLALAAGRGNAFETIDPHRLRPEGDAAERAVSYMLLFRYVPTFATLMYVSHAWSDAGRVLKEWIVIQFATIIDHGAAEAREAALYSLWCDYFEVTERATFLFPRLMQRVRRVGDVIADAGPVPWAVKRAAYREAAADPALHAALARGLRNSFYDIFGSVEPVEARDLFRSITVEDAEVRAALEELTTEPTRWQVVAVVRVDETDERWRQVRLPVRDSYPPGFLMLLRAPGHPAWAKRTELFHRGRWIGRLAHWGVSFDPAIPHETYGALELGGEDVVAFRVEGDVSVARLAVGAEVEAWPKGLDPWSQPAPQGDGDGGGDGDGDG